MGGGLGVGALKAEENLMEEDWFDLYHGIIDLSKQVGGT